MRSYEVALSNRGMQTRVRLDQCRPTAPPLRVRRIERVQLHADLTILAQLTAALNAA